jgi:hypothetical protein
MRLGNSGWRLRDVHAFGCQRGVSIDETWPVDEEWADLVGGGPSQFGRPEIVVVLDARTGTPDANGGVPVVDWGIPVELPARTLEELFKRADAHPVIVANGVVLYTPGEMNLGRTTRLASRAQRRALRALYATCAVHGCAVKFDHCQPHHVHESSSVVSPSSPPCSRRWVATHPPSRSDVDRDLSGWRRSRDRTAAGPPRRIAADQQTAWPGPAPRNGSSIANANRPSTSGPQSLDNQIGRRPTAPRRTARLS